jgi:octaprenyl-diphosphate synthase
MTLPLIHALRNARAADRKWMVGLIQNKDFSSEDFHKLVGLLTSYGAFRYTEKAAGLYIEKAKAALEAFGPSETRQTMLDIADYTLQRRV